MEEAKEEEKPIQPVVDSPNGLVDTTSVVEPTAEGETAAAPLNNLLDITFNKESKDNEIPCVSPPVALTYLCRACGAAATNGLLGTASNHLPKAGIPVSSAEPNAFTGKMSLVEPTVVGESSEKPSNILMETDITMEEPKSGSIAPQMALASEPMDLLDTDEQPIEKKTVENIPEVPFALEEVKEQSEVLTITSLESLTRFFYIRETKQAVYTGSGTSFSETTYNDLRDLCDQVQAQQLADCLEKALINNDECLPRPDEALLVLAVFLSTCTNATERILMRNCVPRLVRTDTELFIFMELAEKLQKIQMYKTPFSRTVRKAVIAWYKERSLDELLRMWAKGEQICSLHNNLLRRVHYKPERMTIEYKATLQLLSTPTKNLVTWPGFLNPLIGSKKIIEGIVKLRSTTNARVAVTIVNELSLTYDQVPERFRIDPTLAVHLIPTLSYEHIFKISPRVLRCYRRAARNAYDNYEHQLFDKTKMEAANIAPLYIYMKILRLESNSRLRNVFCDLYEASFGHNKALGKRLNISVCIDKIYIRKYLKGRNPSSNYLDALVAIAFGYFKTDPDGSKVSYWCDRTGQLKDLKWTKNMTLIEATGRCQTLEVQKSKMDFSQIFLNASEDPEDYDIFLIVVPKATRGNPNNKSAKIASLLAGYRLTRQPKSKIIIISLLASKKSMSYSVDTCEHILELCGISEQMPQIINAFLAEKFR
ncbi:uncharacterized protein LOC117588580 isoform X2 [Drosophila guanche]|uniref:TROVE domain-containing protein n=1 Tax=Drosophila guanche TaxID=7266 RepID=A0A3B0JW50_DROGU|nr:uncharacterized protein LOC117588580 isoform X2 [Drosophila guanche]SPP86307.1 Hypothetical predicted protein [Drosophila guanche]